MDSHSRYASAGRMQCSAPNMNNPREGAEPCLSCSALGRIQGSPHLSTGGVYNGLTMSQPLAISSRGVATLNGP